MLTDRVRYFAAAMAAITAIFYFLIAAHVLQVVENMDGGITIFALVAGCGFLLGTVLLIAWKHRVVWILGALLQVITIAIYFKVGADRTPHFETWGLVMRAPQALIFFSLAYLSLRRMPARVQPAPVH
jgi:hypothetical protein